MYAGAEAPDRSNQAYEYKAEREIRLKWGKLEVAPPPLDLPWKMLEACPGNSTYYSEEALKRLKVNLSLCSTKRRTKEEKKER
jgi:hypothetical protein